MTFRVAINGVFLLNKKCVLVRPMSSLVHRCSIMMLWYTDIKEAVEGIRSGLTSYVGLCLLGL